MCGLAGWCGGGLGGDGGVGILVDGVRHRGPDDRGVWIAPGRSCVLGHARLSIVDLSEAGHQPMVDPVTGHAIVFNGEIYNFRELRKDLEGRGETFRSQSDTEVILALYRRHGPNCLGCLRGMFAFAVWDAARQRLFVARDRVGKKPLNYSVTPKGLLFCSEIGPLARHPDVSTDLDEDALDLFLQLGYIPAPWTIYRSVRKLPPAHYGLFDGAGLSIHPYWNVDYRNKVRMTEQDALDGFEEKLKEAVRLRMLADVPVGALLSGGVDSSVIVAMMADSGAGRIRTFSMGFQEPDLDERPYAGQVARICGTQHHSETIHCEPQSVLEEVAERYGEPFADSSAVPSFFVARAAREHVKVVLNGDGGDELLGGYPRYRLSRLGMVVARVAANGGSVQDLAGRIPGLAECASLPARIRRKWVLDFTHPELRSFLIHADFWNDGDRARLLNRPATGADGALPAWRRDWLGKGREFADNPVDRMLWMDNRTYLPGDLLAKMDIASMHCGLEARSPLLDHEVIEFCARLPATLKVNGGTGKYLLKRMGERMFPRVLMYRRKMGFRAPLAGWLRDPLAPVMTDVLDDTRLMEPLNMDVVRRTRTEFLAGKSGHASRLWALLMFGLWRRVG